MRTLDDITTAVRRAEPVTTEELTLAICAYDDAVQLQEYFVAGDPDPLAYIDPANDPRNAESVHWHKTMIGA